VKDDFIENKNISKGSAIITNNVLSMVPNVKDRQGIAIYPHSLKSTEFMLNLEIFTNVLSTNSSYVLIALVETSSFNSDFHNYKIFEQNYFKARGIGILVNLDNKTIQTDSLEFIFNSTQHRCE